jgi:hypothetical protein
MRQLATKADLLAMKQELQTGLRNSPLRLTLRFGIMWAIAVWAIVIIVK